MITLFLLVSLVKKIVSSKKPLIGALILVSLIGFSAFGIFAPLQVHAVPSNSAIGHKDYKIVKNGRLTVCKINPDDYEVVKKIKMIITAYSSTPDQTDDTPFITASNKNVADGIIANNMLPFGTKIRIPELYGDKIFVVEDRMHSRKGFYHADIWMPTYQDAKKFGAKISYIEVLES